MVRNRNVISKEFPSCKLTHGWTAIPFLVHWSFKCCAP